MQPELDDDPTDAAENRGPADLFGDRALFVAMMHSFRRAR
jgi:hypothetical protein